MKGYYRHSLFGVLSAAVMSLVALASCSEEQGGTVNAADDYVELRMNVSTRAGGDGSASEYAGGDIVAGGDRENIHSLCVMLVDADGTVAWRFLDDNVSEDAALVEFLSDPINIPQGTYDVYAFANFDYYGDLWSQLERLDVGSSFDAEALSGTTIDDPAGKIDLDNGRFIPMSGKNINYLVTAATRIIPVSLDRLVAKVQITIGGGSYKSVRRLTFSGWANRVALFGDGTPDGVQLDGDTTIAVSAAGASDEIVVSPFYVNETRQDAPFTVVVATEESTAGTPSSVYTAQTAIRKLPRNHIYPLNISVNDWSIDISARCWVSPIGSYPVQVKADFEPDTYTIGIPEGSQFEFTLNGLANVPGSECTWNIDPGTTTGIVFEDGYASGNVVKGHVTASAGNAYRLGVVARWSDGGNNYERKYTVIINTTDISDAEFMSGVGSYATRYGLRRLPAEVVNVRRNVQ